MEKIVDMTSKRPVVLEPIEFDYGLEGLYEIFGMRLFRIAYLHLGDKALAHDVLQDVFIKIYLKKPNLDDPLPYLTKCVVNSCKSKLRRRKIEFKYLPRFKDGKSEQNQIDEILELLSRLSNKERSAIVLRYYLDLSTEEIASALKCKVGTVSSLISRGQKKLKVMLEDSSLNVTDESKKPTPFESGVEQVQGGI
ncbi:MAG: sigma-70 family RNA polymerase sigma factor [Acidimicrobiales bacterium]|nr:sigma-70 family RNA polymerase sigma factor [Acidimicrobiales bacterium]